jgi:hypothetical protein
LQKSSKREPPQRSSDNYLIDVKFGIIMDVEASRTVRKAEVGAAKTMIERTQECIDIRAARRRHGLRFRGEPRLARQDREHVAYN